MYHLGFDRGRRSYSKLFKTDVVTPVKKYEEVLS
jgi:hypothetical protein